MYKKLNDDWMLQLFNRKQQKHNAFENAAKRSLHLQSIATRLLLALYV